MSKEMYGLLIDYEYCSGCQSCEVTCKETHNYPVGKWGIRVLDDGPCQPAAVRLEGSRGGRPGGNPRDSHAGTAQVSIQIHEGRKRQVKRMFLAIHHRVIKLHRNVFGPLSLGDLESGAWRLLTADEVAALKEATGL